MNLPRLKKPGIPLTALNACMSSSSKSTNHYDTLQVNQDSTQEEIKSSYYKLSKQYHPDVNSTEEAKEKFRNISDAYEILGNYKNRQRYDRGMTARGYSARESRYDEKEQKHAAFHRSRMRTYPRPVATNSKVYDFDAWTRAHYGYTFERTIQRRKTNLNVKETRDKKSEIRKYVFQELGLYIGILLIIITLLTLVRGKENYDIPLDENKEKSGQ